MAKLNEFGAKPRQDFPALLKASDLTEPVTYTITAVEVRNLKGEAKPIASFEETPKQWVINKTNIGAFVKKYGDLELSGLVGKKVTLAAVSTTFQGSQTEGVRIVGFPA
jgi:hypothetical protein